MSEAEALLKDLRIAKEKLMLLKPQCQSVIKEPASDVVNKNDHRVWDLKLRLAIEQNIELEERLAREIHQRYLAEQYTQQQIRHLQSMIQTLVQQQQQPFVMSTPSNIPTQPDPLSVATPQRHRRYSTIDTIQNNLSPLLTEVMHVQLKFAETMQKLDESVHARDKLLPPHKHQPTWRSYNDPQDSFESYPSEKNYAIPAPPVSMETFTEVIDRDESPVRCALPPTPQTIQTLPRATRTNSPAHVIEEPVQYKQRQTPETRHHHVQFEDGTTSENDVMRTPKVDRSIHFQDCGDDDCEDDDDDDDFDAVPTMSAVDANHVARSSSDAASVISTDLDRSSFLEEFARFRHSLPRAVMSSTKHNNNILYDMSLATLDELKQLRQQLSLDIQGLTTDLTLMMIMNDHPPSSSSSSVSPQQLQQMQEAIDACKDRLLAVNARMDSIVNPRHTIVNEHTNVRDEKEGKDMSSYDPKS
jgi:hypothetical protein